jgi:hypothetical protein
MKIANNYKELCKKWTLLVTFKDLARSTGMPRPKELVL